jgi:hypothetical protein
MFAASLTCVLVVEFELKPLWAAIDVDEAPEFRW